MHYLLLAGLGVADAPSRSEDPDDLAVKDFPTSPRTLKKAWLRFFANFKLLWRTSRVSIGLKNLMPNIMEQLGGGVMSIAECIEDKERELYPL